MPLLGVSMFKELTTFYKVRADKTDTHTGEFAAHYANGCIKVSGSHCTDMIWSQLMPLGSFRTDAAPYVL